MKNFPIETFKVNECIRFRLKEIIGALMDMQWTVYILLLHLISLNRLIEICSFQRAKMALFSDKATTVSNI